MDKGEKEIKKWVEKAKEERSTMKGCLHVKGLLQIKCICGSPVPILPPTSLLFSQMGKFTPREETWLVSVRKVNPKYFLPKHFPVAHRPSAAFTEP